MMLSRLFRCPLSPVGQRAILYAMQAMRRRRSAMLGVLLGFGAAGMTGACGQTEPAPLDSCVTPPDTPPPDEPTDCAAPMGDPCMRYHIPLDGNPSTDVALRNKYIAAFGSACYISVVNTFDCFYKTWQAACADAVKIAEVAGAAPFDKGYTCQAVVGTEDYSLQVGPDVANKITINYQAAPLESSFIDVDGTPTEINGPYRNLPQSTTIKPGADFDCKTGIVGEDGSPLNQRQWILQVNRNANAGKIRSDLAGFMYPCKTGCPEICTEPELLKDPADENTPRYDPYRAEVNHEVRKTDKRGCDWGTNANKNAAVISGRLNRYFYNNYPLKKEVEQINNVPPYTP
jgi:hypothetical protein